jgi:hypothetical protein
MIQEFTHRVEQVVGTKRFLNEAAAFRQLAGQMMARHVQHAHLGMALFQQLRQLHPALARKRDVGEEHVDRSPVLMGQLQRLFGVFRLQDRTTGVRQNMDDQWPDPRRVVDQQNGLSGPFSDASWRWRRRC